jgi:flagellar biogenesis protein FliO
MISSIAVIALLGALEAPTDSTAAGEGSAARAAQPAPPSAADAIVAAAFGKTIDTATPDLKAGAPASPTLEWTNLVAPALGLLGLAALAATLARRRRVRPGQIAILESAALGPKRSLVIADVLGDRLVLAVSEAGVTVLSTRAAPAADPALEAFAPSSTDPAPRLGLWRRLFGRPSTPRFEEALAESIEDQELRAKLAAGYRGTSA